MRAPPSSPSLFQTGPSASLMAFVVGVDIAAILSSATLPTAGAGGADLLPLLILLAALAGLLRVPIGPLRTTFAPTHPVVLCAVAASGGHAAVVTALAGLSGAIPRQIRARAWLRAGFNMGNAPLSAVAAFWAFRLAGGRTGGELAAVLGPLLAGTLVYFVVNSALVTCALCLERSEGFGSTWKRTFVWGAPPFFVGITVAAGLLWAIQTFGAFGLILGLPPCWLISSYYRLQRTVLHERELRLNGA